MILTFTIIDSSDVKAIKMISKEGNKEISPEWKKLNEHEYQFIVPPIRDNFFTYCDRYKYKLIVEDSIGNDNGFKGGRWNKVYRPRYGKIAVTGLIIGAAGYSIWKNRCELFKCDCPPDKPIKPPIGEPPLPPGQN